MDRRRGAADKGTEEGRATPCLPFSTSSTDNSSAKVTNPKPRERPVTRSIMTIESTICPKLQLGGKRGKRGKTGSRSWQEMCRSEKRQARAKEGAIRRASRKRTLRSIHERLRRRCSREGRPRRSCSSASPGPSHSRQRRRPVSWLIRCPIPAGARQVRLVGTGWASAWVLALGVTRSLLGAWGKASCLAWADSEVGSMALTQAGLAAGGQPRYQAWTRAQKACPAHRQGLWCSSVSTRTLA